MEKEDKEDKKQLPTHYMTSYVLEGVLQSFDRKPHRGRIYPKEDYQIHIDELKERIKKNK